MFDKQKYVEYLAGTRKSDATANEYLNIVEKFHRFIEKYRGENAGSSDIRAVEAFFETYNVPHMYSVFKGVMQCIKEYADYLLKNAGNPELSSIAEAIKETFATRFKQKAIDFALSRKKLILPVPENALIEPKYLNGLENDEFVAVFRELQNLIVSIYDEIEKSPFEWGFPDSEYNDGYYNRVPEFLFGFVRSGKYIDGVITVDTKVFAGDNDLKKHKKRELIIKGLENAGFVIEGFGNKTNSFEVTFPDNNNLLNVLNSYVNAVCEHNFKWITEEKYPCYWTLSRHKYSFSYRYIEKRALQKHEMPFLVELDYSTEKGKEALLYVHAEAAKHGCVIDINKPLNQMFHDSIIFKNGDKSPLYIGENQYQYWHGGSFYRGITINILLKNVFTTEREKIDKLISRFPEVFKEACEEMRTRKNFSGKWLWFEDLTPEDVKDIFEMYIIENNLN